MQRPEVRRRRTHLRRLVLAQVGVTGLAMVIAYLMAQSEGLKAVVTGAMVAFLPHLFFVYRMGWLRNIPARGNRSVQLFRAEAGKFGLTVALFALVFVTAPPSNPAFFFSAYAAVVLMHWLVPWLMPENRPIDLR